MIYAYIRLFLASTETSNGSGIRAFQVEVLPILSDATSTSFGGHGELQVWVHIQGAGAE